MGLLKLKFRNRIHTDLKKRTVHIQMTRQEVLQYEQRGREPIERACQYFLEDTAFTECPF